MTRNCSLGLFALVVALVGCSHPSAVEEDRVRVQARNAQVEIRNLRGEAIFFTLMESQFATVANWAPCSDPDVCPRVGPGRTVRVEQSEIAGIEEGGDEAILFWWELVPADGGGFEPDEVRATSTSVYTMGQDSDLFKEDAARRAFILGTNREQLVDVAPERGPRLVDAEGAPYGGRPADPRLEHELDVLLVEKSELGLVVFVVGVGAHRRKERRQPDPLLRRQRIERVRIKRIEPREQRCQVFALGDEFVGLDRSERAGLVRRGDERRLRLPELDHQRDQRRDDRRHPGHLHDELPALESHVPPRQ